MPAEMRALYAFTEGLKAGMRPLPEPAGDAVRLRVLAAGLCRTDVMAAQGVIATPPGRILGHEFCGVVDLAPSTARDAWGMPLGVGQRIAVLPVLPCGRCVVCKPSSQAFHARNDRPQPKGTACAQGEFLGVAWDGAFAEAVVVPGYAVYPVADHVPDEHVVFAEPLAAALAVLEAPLERSGRGLVYGDGRIANMVAAVLAWAGFEQIEVRHDAEALLPDAYDFAIETRATSTTLTQLSAAVRPGGTIVLKSRTFEPVTLVPAHWTLRRQTLSAVHYGDFALALRLLEEGAIDVAPLVGPRLGFAAFAEQLRRAPSAHPNRGEGPSSHGEFHKPMLVPALDRTTG